MFLALILFGDDSKFPELAIPVPLLPNSEDKVVGSDEVDENLFVFV
jgi:hypothetical protein